MKMSAVVTALGVADSTVRKYATEYSEYLSPSGMGGEGRHRDFTDHDLRVLKLIFDMKSARQSDDNIDATLRSLQANGWERLPPLDGNALALIPSPGEALAAQADRLVMQKEIDMLREQIADLKAERADRDELVRQLAEARTLLKLYDEGRLKPPGG